MEHPEKALSEQESLDLITRMIAQAKQSYYDTGLSAMLWGIVIAVCSLVRLSELQFHYELPVDIYWLTVVAIIPQVMISMKEKKLRPVKTYDDVYMDYVWFAFAISIVLLIVVVNVMYGKWSEATGSTNGFQLYEYLASFYLLLYGIPTFITGAACRFRPMLWGGLLCWASCIVAAFTPIKIDLLLTAASALAAWFYPGILMQRDFRKAQRELAKNNV